MPPGCATDLQLGGGQEKLMPDIYTPADRISLDASGGLAIGNQFPLSGSLSTQGLTVNGQPLTRGAIVGFRVVLLANTGPSADTIIVRIYKNSQTSQTSADLGEELYEAQYVFSAVPQTQSDMFEIEYPFFEQPFITIEPVGVTNPNVNVTPLVKAVV